MEIIQQVIMSLVVSGGTIKIGGNWTSSTTGFSPTGGTVELMETQLNLLVWHLEGIIFMI